MFSFQFNYPHHYQSKEFWESSRFSFIIIDDVLACCLHLLAGKVRLRRECAHVTGVCWKKQSRNDFV